MQDRTFTDFEAAWAYYIVHRNHAIFETVIPFREWKIKLV